MYRKPIYETEERYSEAVENVLELKKQGIEDEEIPNKLSTIFKESDIVELLKDLSKLPTLTENMKLKHLLKISLWVLLILKIFIVPLFLLTVDVAAYWKLLVFFASLIIAGLSLYMAYKASYENVFFILLLSFLFSSDSFVENFEIIFTMPILSLEWWLSLLPNISFILAFYSSWRLKKYYPSQLLKLDRIIKKRYNQQINTDAAM